MSVLHLGRLASLALVAASLGTGLLACAPHEAPPGRIVDDLGHQVTLARPVQRIVSLSPSTTELLFAIGAGNRLVGRTRWCDFPPEVAAVPSVGDGLNPNLELLLGRAPDLVVFYASAANESVVKRLDDLGIAAASVRLDRLDHLARAARLLGRLTGTSPRADSLAATFEAQLDSARAAGTPADVAAAPAASSPSPRTVRSVAVVAWDNPPIVIGAGSFLTELLALAGARNVFDDLARPSAQTGIEVIAARNPDALLILGEGIPAFAERPEWQNVGAVRRGSFVAVRGSEFERPSFRSLEAARTLRAALARGRSP